MFYNNNLKGYGKGYVGRKKCRRMTAERPPKDRRGITDLWVENQQLAIMFGLHAQCADFQWICNCHIEGT